MNLKKHQNISFIRELLKSLVLGIVIFFVLYLFLWIDEINSYNFKYYFGISMMYSIVGYLSNKYLSRHLNKMIPWDKHPTKRMVYGILWSIIITFFVFVILNYVQSFILVGYSFGEYLSKMNFSQFKLPIYISIVIFLSFYSFYFYKEVQELKLEESKLQTENAKAKFNAIKTQIDPHFLFNNLNVLYSIIDENPKNAKKFVKNLSSIYRYILDNKDSDLTSLESEIEFAKKYLELLKFRFEDSLNFTIQVENNNSKIVSLGSQISLENAIKHNKITDDSPLNLKIFTEDNYLVIENNYNPISNSEGTKLGLKSINERCKYLLNKEIVVDINKGKYIVKIPLLTK